MIRYNVNQAWVDPFEVPPERRTADRFPIRLKLSVTADLQGGRRQIVGPAILENLSRSGALVRTKHDLEAGQRITLALPSDCFIGETILPEVFVGPATVIRSTVGDDRVNKVALEFSDAFTNNMEFVLFVEFLQQTTRTLSS